MRILKATLFIVALLVVPEANAATDLDDAVNSLCGDVSEYMAGRDVSILLVDEFESVETNSAGRMLRDKFRKRLKDNHSIDCPISAAEIAEKKPALKLKGQYFHTALGSRHVVKVRCKILDTSTFEEHNAFQEKIVDETGDIVKLLGLTVDAFNGGDASSGSSGNSSSAEATSTTTVSTEAVASSATAEQLVQTSTEAVTEAATSPKFVSIGNEIAATSSSPYRVEIYAKRDGTYVPIPAVDKGGLAFAELQEGDTFAVRLINHSDADVSVELTIDGLNSFRFSENPAFKRQGRWLIQAGTGGKIKGWHKDGSTFYEFVVVPEPESALAELGEPTSSVGTITASFFPSWRAGQVPPSIETKLASDDVTKRATGKGALIAENVDVIPAVFHGQTLLASVSIRYENPDPPSDLPVE